MGPDVGEGPRDPSDPEEVEAMEPTKTEDRIRRCAQSAERLVASLATLADRIDAARRNGNQELLQHYQKEFDQASLKFMGNVEAILDDYYVLKGRKRSRIANEPLDREELTRLQRTVQSLVIASPEGRDGRPVLLEEEPEVRREAPFSPAPPNPRRGPRVDLRG